MKRTFIPAGILLAMNIAFTTSCGTISKNNNIDEDSLIVKIEDNGYEYSLIYDSENARNAPAFKNGEIGSPLAVQDARKQYFKAVDTEDIWGGYENGVLTYSVALLNTSNDTIVIDSFEFPDTRFKARVGSPFYGKGYLSWVKLEPDSMVDIKDYRFIINYKNNKYPPQTIHVNFYPDKASADKAHDERVAGVEE